jgi:hypothetical protein
MALSKHPVRFFKRLEVFGRRPLRTIGFRLSQGRGSSAFVAASFCRAALLTIAAICDRHRILSSQRTEPFRTRRPRSLFKQSQDVLVAGSRCRPPPALRGPRSETPSIITATSARPLRWRCVILSERAGAGCRLRRVRSPRSYPYHLPRSRGAGIPTSAHIARRDCQHHLLKGALIQRIARTPARQLGRLSSCPSTPRARGRLTFTRRPPITSGFGTCPERSAGRPARCV